MRYLLLAFILSCSGKHMTGPSDNPHLSKCKHHHEHEHHHDNDRDKDKMEKQR